MNEIIIHATKRMNLENMLSERSQTYKITYYKKTILRTGENICK